MICKGIYDIVLLIDYEYKIENRGKMGSMPRDDVADAIWTGFIIFLVLLNIGAFFC